MSTTVRIKSLKEWKSTLRILFSLGYTWRNQDIKPHKKYFKDLGALYLEFYDNKNIVWDDVEYTAENEFISYGDFLSKFRSGEFF